MSAAIVVIIALVSIGAIRWDYSLFVIPLIMPLRPRVL